MNTQPAVAGAAIIAGLIVGAGTYSARHGVGGPGAETSLATVAPQVPAIPHVRLAHWHPIRLPREARGAITPPATATLTAPTPIATATSQPPVTRSSPVASTDDSGEGGDD